jgi:hypothetical protein
LTKNEAEKFPSENGKKVNGRKGKKRKEKERKGKKGKGKEKCQSRRAAAPTFAEEKGTRS